MQVSRSVGQSVSQTRQAGTPAQAEFYSIKLLCGTHAQGQNVCGLSCGDATLQGPDPPHHGCACVLQSGSNPLQLPACLPACPVIRVAIMCVTDRQTDSAWQTDSASADTKPHSTRPESHPAATHRPHTCHTSGLTGTQCTERIHASLTPRTVLIDTAQTEQSRKHRASGCPAAMPIAACSATRYTCATCQAQGRVPPFLPHTDTYTAPSVPKPCLQRLKPPLSKHEINQRLLQLGLAEADSPHTTTGFIVLTHKTQHHLSPPLPKRHRA